MGKGQLAIIAIQRPSISADCITAAQLRLQLEQPSDLAAGELAVYPSHVFDAATKRSGERYGYWGSVLDIRPRARLEEAGAGWTHLEVTDIVKRWMGRKPFPSRGLVAPKKGPIVLTLRDVDGAEPFGTATVVSSDARANNPLLIVTHTPACKAG